jgi:hypothetical protein
MAKRYVEYRSDLAAKANLDTWIATHSDTKSFPIGAMFVTADGDLHIVTANDGSTVTTATVGVQT